MPNFITMPIRIHIIIRASYFILLRYIAFCMVITLSKYGHSVTVSVSGKCVYYFRGWQNYLAWASQSTVVVLEPQSVQVLQTLTHGASVVKKVCFYRSLTACIHILTDYCFCILSYRFAGLVMLFIIHWLRHTSFV